MRITPFLNRRRNISMSIAAALLALATSSLASASLVNWTVSGSFDDGGTFNGTFTYDADSGQPLSNWDLTLAGGNTANFAPVSLTPADSTDGLSGHPGGVVIVPFAGIGGINGLLFNLGFSPNLTDAGGSAALVTNDDSDFGEFLDNGLGPSRGFASGSGVGVPAAVPEPASLSLLAVGSLAFLGRRRRVTRI